MRSTAKTKRVLGEIMSGERNAPSEDYRSGVVATLRWMVREVSEEPMAKELPAQAVPADEGSDAVHRQGVAVPKPVRSVRRKR